jgi:hypothetical protein
MSYKVKVKDSIHTIVEKDTELVVYENEDYLISKKMCRALNLGSGFQGHTPEFFCLKYNYVK